MRRRNAWSIIMFLAVALSGCEDPPASSLRIDSLVRARLASLEDVPGPILDAPEGIIPWRDSLAILDPRAPQIAILPTTLQGGRAFGKHGEGPGELRRPRFLLARGDSLYVNNQGNVRLTVFDPDGRILKERPYMSPVFNGSFIPIEEERVLHPITDPDHYVVVDSSGDKSRKWAPRPPEFPFEPALIMVQDFLVESGSDLFVVDAHNVAALRLESPDSLVISRPQDEVLKEVTRRADSLRTREMTFDPISRVTVSDEGLLVWFLGKEDPCGALIDRSGRWIPIVGAGAHEEFPKWPYGLLYWEGELYVLDQEGVRVYSVEEVKG